MEAAKILTESEMTQFLNAARSGRHGARDFAMMLMTYRHGLRVSELIDIRLNDVDLVTARLFVRRKKGSLSTHQPIDGYELRAIRAWLRERSLDSNAACSPFLFVSERGPMTRQAVNYLRVKRPAAPNLPLMYTRICCGIRVDSTWRTRGWIRG
jgi:type 1 fimbriae regulatory protein FimB